MKTNKKKIIRTALWDALIGVIVSLLFCTVLACGTLLKMLMPVWLFLGFGILYWILDVIPAVSKRSAVKYAVLVIFAAAIILLLHFA